MSDNSHIQWTDATWNTITGCTRVSDGCLNCYIDRTPPFRMAHRRFDSREIGGTTGVILHDDRLTLPLTWRKPRRVFVNSLSDLFHEAVPDRHITALFDVMESREARHHTFQLLTKRPARMRSFMRRRVLHQAQRGRLVAPAPNIWLGCSVESQQWADIRIPQLLDTPAAVRFLSCEPLLGEVRLSAWLATPTQCGCRSPICSASPAPEPHLIDWVIVGGESGPGARPMDSLWAMDLVVQCSGNHIPVFVKQLGSVWARENGAIDRKGGDPAEWPLGLQVREFPRVPEAVSAR